MSRRALTFNKSDWSGESTTIEVDPATNSFEMFGYVFTLVFSDHVDDVGRKVAHVHGDAWSSGPLFVMYQWPSTSRRAAETGYKWDDWVATNSGVERDHKDPFVVAAQVLCNTV